MEIFGALETHLTVVLHNAEETEILRQWASDHAMKFLHIVLDRGASVSQPMLTRHSHGTLTKELQTAEASCRSLAAEGFSVSRVKIEVASENPGVPQTNADAANRGCDRYFEHHIKLLLEPDADTRDLAQIAERHTARLSRNALRVRGDGRREQFVTQRCFLAGNSEARRRLCLLQNDLAALDFPILETEAEYVVYDSNLALDAGWLQQEDEPR